LGETGCDDDADRRPLAPTLRPIMLPPLDDERKESTVDTPGGGGGEIDAARLLLKPVRR
jgi:hypothetical protein